MSKASQVHAVNKEYIIIVNRIKGATVCRQQKAMALNRLQLSKQRVVAGIYGDNIVQGLSIDDYEGVDYDDKTGIVENGANCMP